jgi:hypothetical protein
MIRKKTGLKEVTLLVLASAAFVSVACSDDDDDLYGGTAGTSGSSSTAGKAGDGGSAGSAGKSNGGSAGTTTAGTTNGGSAGTTSGGMAGTESMGGDTTGGVPPDGQGGEPTVGGAGGEGGAPVVEMDTLKNPSFEASLAPGGNPPDSGTKVFPEWDNTATPDGASYIQWDGASSGSVRLAQWNAGAYTARTSQTISPIANGTYSFSIKVNRDALDKLNDSYLYAVGYDINAPEEDVTEPTDAAVGNTYVKITLANIVVSSGSLTVGVYTDAVAGGWINFDDAELVLTSE